MTSPIEAERVLAGIHVGRVRVAILSLLYNWSSCGGNDHTAQLGISLSGIGYDVRHWYARFADWGIGRVEGTSPFASEAIVFEPSDWNLVTIKARYREVVDRFSPDVVIVTDAWNFKPHLADAIRLYPYLLLIEAKECLCPLNNQGLLPGGEQCPNTQLADAARCRSCLAENAATSDRLRTAERELSGVGTTAYEELLRRAVREARAVLTLDAETAADFAPHGDSAAVVPWDSHLDQSLSPGSLDGLAVVIEETIETPMKRPMQGEVGGTRLEPTRPWLDSVRRQYTPWLGTDCRELRIVRAFEQATASGTQMTPPQYLRVLLEVLRRAPGNVLIFGAGRDTEMWVLANQGGRTVVIEDDPQWLHPVAGSELVRVRYDTVLRDGFREDLPQLAGIPPDLFETSWDVILVDGPAGCGKHLPGRQQSIDAARRLAGPTTTVFLHDAQRPHETICAERILGRAIERVGSQLALDVFTFPRTAERLLGVASDRLRTGRIVLASPSTSEIQGLPDGRPPALFVLATGRCGTMTLAHLLDLHPDVDARHEPAPHLLKETLKAHAAFDLERCQAEFLAARQAPIERANGLGRTYAETACRMTWLAPAIASCVPGARFVHLHRHPADVVVSGRRRGWYQNHPSDSVRITPRTNDPCRKQWANWNPLARTCWYWDAVNREALEFVATMPPERCFTLAFDDLIDRSGRAVAQLFAFLQVSPPSPRSVRDVLEGRLNAQKKGNFPKPGEWNDQQRQVLEQVTGETRRRLGYALLP